MFMFNGYKNIYLMVAVALLGGHGAQMVAMAKSKTVHVLPVVWDSRAGREGWKVLLLKNGQDIAMTVKERRGTTVQNHAWDILKSKGLAQKGHWSIDLNAKDSSGRDHSFCFYEVNYTIFGTPQGYEWVRFSRGHRFNVVAKNMPGHVKPALRQFLNMKAHGLLAQPGMHTQQQAQIRQQAPYQARPILQQQAARQPQQPYQAQPPMHAGAPVARLSWLSIPRAILFYDSGQPYFELTNFYKGNVIKIDNIDWPTSEHYYQAQKFPGNKGQQIKVSKMKTAREVFNAVRNVPVPAGWHTTGKFVAMRRALDAKFKKGSKLWSLLDRTGNAILVENAGAKDDQWGAGATGLGHNHLGRMLMVVRQSNRDNVVYPYDPATTLTLTSLQTHKFDPAAALRAARKVVLTAQPQQQYGQRQAQVRQQIPYQAKPAPRQQVLPAKQPARPVQQHQTGQYYRAQQQAPWAQGIQQLRLHQNQPHQQQQHQTAQYSQAQRQPQQQEQQVGQQIPYQAKRAPGQQAAQQPQQQYRQAAQPAPAQTIPAHTVSRATIRPSWLMTQQEAAQYNFDPQWWRTMTNQFINPRKNFVEDLIGIPEDQFRHHMGWPKNKKFDPTKTKSHNWVKDWRDKEGHFRRAAVFQGKLTHLAAFEWGSYANQMAPMSNRGYFSILFDDPFLPWESDIRYLQSIPENKGAAFQIASTFFGPLEGGMADHTAKLGEMFPHAAQGEEATACTAGATFYRKYCMDEALYLLYHVKNLPIKYTRKPGGKMRFEVDPAALKTYRASKQDLENILVVAHDNIVVTGGYGPHEGHQQGIERGDNACQRLTVYTNPDGTVDTQKSQTICQLFSSAVNLNPFLDRNTGTWWRGIKPQEKNSIIQAAQIALGASYAGTIVAAYVLRKPRLYLTLMGCGAFRNEIGWVAPALNPELIGLAAQKGMQMTLVYRADTRYRNAQQDYNFLMNMITSFDSANKTAYASDPTIKQWVQYYVQAAYSKNNAEQSRAAKVLNNIFMRLVAR